MQCFGIQVVVGLDDINESTVHIIYFDVHFASQLLQMKFHLSVIGVGHDVEVGLACILFIYAKERGLEKLFELQYKEGFICKYVFFFLLKHSELSCKQVTPLNISMCFS